MHHTYTWVIQEILEPTNMLIMCFGDVLRRQVKSTETYALRTLEDKPSMPNNQQQLKFINSETISFWVQVDIVDFTWRPDGVYKWVLLYVGHHHGFSRVDYFPDKEAETFGRALLKFLSTAVMPEILQSREFTEKCISIIQGPCKASTITGLCGVGKCFI